MAKKLWDKNSVTDSQIEKFTVGRDREMDLYLAPFDVLGNMAHIRMIESIGLLTSDELKTLHNELVKILADAKAGSFVIEEGVEDVHSQVEMLLTQNVGEMGKKVHSGRSRNDQVLLDLKLFFRDRIKVLVENVSVFFETLIEKSNQHKDVLLPGYTHLQVAMPSSFGLWFGAYAESLADDMELLLAAWNITNRNPLGSAAGYGSSFPLNRTMTTQLLGFESLSYNVVYAQMGRGKTERTLSWAMASVASTLARMAMDVCLFINQNFGFIKLPDAFTTGSSIMPHKKNPDVFELIRAKCNKLQALPVELSMIINNLPSGYQRDMQILKESLFPAIDDLLDCLQIADAAIKQIEIQPNILEKLIYDHLFSVEVVNDLVMKGVPFRDAYKQIGLDIAAGTYKPEKTVNHTHEGSIGNLCNAEIEARFDNLSQRFGFAHVDESLAALAKIMD